MNNGLAEFIEVVARFTFMQNALIAVIVIGIVSGVMGAFVVTRGMAFLGDALAHTVLPGVAIAYITSGGNALAVQIGGLIAGALSAIGIGLLTRDGRVKEDTAIGVVFAGALALGIGIMSKTQNFSTDLNHLLIGNIMGITDETLRLMLVVGVIVIAAVVLLYKELLLISFDPLLAHTLRLPGERLRLGLLVLLSLTVVVSLQAVGVAMVTAMLVTPAATARLLVNRMHHLMLVAAGIGALGGVIGFYFSWSLEVAPSATIVLTLTALFALAFTFAPHKGWAWGLVARRA